MRKQKFGLEDDVFSLVRRDHDLQISIYAPKKAFTPDQLFVFFNKKIGSHFLDNCDLIKLSREHSYWFDYKGEMIISLEIGDYKEDEIFFNYLSVKPSPIETYDSQGLLFLNLLQSKQEVRDNYIFLVRNHFRIAIKEACL